MNTGKPEEFVPAEKRAEMLEEMGRLVSAFYYQAAKIGCHPFLEFCGLMTEYLKVCTEAQKQGIDFTNTTAHSGYALPIQRHNATYLGEKVGCIYGPALQIPENGRAFLEAVGLTVPQITARPNDDGRS